MKQLNMPISGMHCRSCEMILEKSIGKLPNVSRITADHSKGMIKITYNNAMPDMKKVEKIINENGYTLGSGKVLPWFTSEIDDYIEFFSIIAGVFIVYMIFQAFGISFGSMGNISSPTLGVAFFVGLTAGVSSCMALVGGLVLGISSKWNQSHENSSSWSRFEPHLYFNLGRVLGFGILGGLLGMFGSFVSVSTSFLGLMTILVGAVMLFLGINLTGLSPRLASTSITLPKFLGKNVGNDVASTKLGTMSTGALTFFLPCGFTLAMQMYAISTGSFVAGALTLGLFALGTAPGLIGIGGISALVKGVWAKRFFRLTGVLVLVLGIFNISNAYTLISLGSTPKAIQTTIDPSTMETQEIHMTEDNSGYSPTVVHIKPNHKIRIIFDAKNPYSCASQFTAPKVNVSAHLKLGENIVEFISPASGEVPFSCSMGMYSGKFVIDAEDTNPLSQNTEIDQRNSVSKNIFPVASAQTPPPSRRGSSGGCSMMGGGANSVSQTTESSVISSPNPNAPTETIRLTYTSNGLSNQQIKVKKGINYKIIIDVKDTISGCMHMIFIPGMDTNAQELNAGNTVEFNIYPTESGEFPLTCAMGVPHGYIIVE